LKIHRTASIDPQAQLADDVEIGPFCTIQGNVRIDVGTRIIGNAWLVGPLIIGKNNILYPNVSLGFEPQHHKYIPGTGAGVAIGDNNILREGVTIHRATGDRPTTVGDNNMLMCNAHLGHDAVIGSDCVLANGALLAGHVTLFDAVTLGGNAAVHQFCRIGRLGMLSGGVVVTQDLPPFCTVYNMRAVGSLNVIGLRRAGYRANIPNLKTAFKILYQSRHTAPNAADRIEEELGDDLLCAELVAFLRTTKRGITRYSSSYQSEDVVA
jgi:UDP-N-acetylglucosamine acyltransferase